MSTQKRKRVDISEQFFNVYHRVPDGVKVFTDPLVKTGIRTERAMKPSMIKNRAKADIWINTHITSKINNAKTKVGNAASGVKKITNRLPKRK